MTVVGVASWDWVKRLDPYSSGRVKVLQIKAVVKGLNKQDITIADGTSTSG